MFSGQEIPYNGMNQLEYNTAANLEPAKIKVKINWSKIDDTSHVHVAPEAYIL